MLRAIALFEVRYQTRQPLFFLTFSLFFLLCFGATTWDKIQIGGNGTTHVNAPFTIAQTLGIMSIFGLFIIVAMMGNIVLRDQDTKMSGILFSTLITKRAYLFGRFIGAFAATLLAFSGAIFGIYIGSLMPWIDPDKIGPNTIQFYLVPFFTLALPSLFCLGALFFAIATMTRSLITTYAAVIGFLVIYFVALTVLDKPSLMGVAALADPFGLAAFAEITRYWTGFDRNSLIVPLEGHLLMNRALWGGFGFVMLALAYGRFSFTEQARRPKKAVDQTVAPARPRAVSTRSAITLETGAGAARAQLWARTRFEVLSVVKSTGFLVLLALGILNALGSLLNLNELYDTPIYPVTRVMVTTVHDTFGIIPLLIVIYYSAELVWRDASVKLNEIIDATPTPSWVFSLSKFAAMAVVLISLMVASILAAIVVQLIQGYTKIELGLYVSQLIGNFGGTVLLIAVLAIFIQVASGNKYLGMFFMVLYVVFGIVAEGVGFTDYLYRIATLPRIRLSDMNGSGHFLYPTLMFQFYWGLFSVALMILAHGIWTRGATLPLRHRVMRMPGRLGPIGGSLLMVSLLGFGATGGYLYYNTHVLNAFKAIDHDELLQVAYEKKFASLENLPQPRITGVKLTVALYPHDRSFHVKGTNTLENHTDMPLTTVHVFFNDSVVIDHVSVEGASVTTADEAFNYTEFTLTPPLQPGEKRVLSYELHRDHPGFQNIDDDTEIVANGTFVNNLRLAPYIGFAPQYILMDRFKRTKYGLPPRPRIADLDDVQAHGNSYLRTDSDLITYDMAVSTSLDQTALAPGYLDKDWVEDGRHFFHYTMDTPIWNFYGVQSGRYIVEKDRWNAVEIAVYYDPKHPYNVKRMIESVKKSLEYFTQNFGPYQHKQVRIVEFPAYSTFAQALPNTVPFSEGIGFIADNRDPDAIDYAFYVTAHEVAHQWWAHQVLGANVQGSTMLSESFAQYSALMVMEHQYGKDQIRRFLKFELDRYLSARGREQIGELPLYRVEDQPYIHYRKGSVAMYALKDYIGEDTVNRALARLIKEQGLKGPPYPTSRDFLTDLRAEAGPAHQDLITDLFEKITLFTMKIESSQTEKLPNGQWQVRLTVTAAKFEADAKGKETPAPIDQMIDIGAFLTSPAEADFKADGVLYLQKHRITEPHQVISFTVDKEPAFVGIDPYAKLISRSPDTNIAPAKLAPTEQKAATAQ